MQSANAKSKNRPASPCSRPTSPANRLTAAYKPVNTSAIATPTFIGGPSGSPVIDISPLEPCTTKS